MYINMSVTLSKDSLSTLPGICLKWTYAGLGVIKELSLVYFKNAVNSDIVSVDIQSGLVRTNISSGFDSGSEYTFQLQAVDVSNTTVYSNSIVIEAPWILTTPVITSSTGVDNGIKLHLGATTNLLTSADTVEFVVRKEDNTVFWLVKQFTSTGEYTLSSSDSAELMNYTSYRVACMFQPAVSNTRYKSPSSISNTIDAYPTNLPNAPTSVTISSLSGPTYGVICNWVKPTDFDEWSDLSYNITVTLNSSVGDISMYVIENQDLLTHQFHDLDGGKTYSFNVYYSNTLGDGAPSVESASVLPVKTPSAPTLSVEEGDSSNILTWLPPSDPGQSAVITYTVRRGSTHLGNIGGTTFTDTGLTNGVEYSYTVTAINSVGSGIVSDPVLAIPFGTMTIQSTVIVGKTITTTIVPNGRPIESVLFLAVDNDPNNFIDSDFVVTIPQISINQARTGTIQVIKTFSTFTSDISFACVVVHNESNSAFYKSTVV